MREAERIFEESAAEFLALDYLSNPQNQDWAAAAQVKRALLAVRDGRIDEGFAVMEKLMDQGASPARFETLPGLHGVALEVWELLLEDRGEFERLYDIAGTALAYLDPMGSPQERRAYAMATKRRADAAKELGRQDEAIQTYELAISRLNAQDLALVGYGLPRAMLSYAELLSEQGRQKEAISVSGRAIVTFFKLVLSEKRHRNVSKGFSSREPS